MKALAEIDLAESDRRFLAQFLDWKLKLTGLQARLKKLSLRRLNDSTLCSGNNNARFARSNYISVAPPLP